jgi:hypothetical protein
MVTRAQQPQVHVLRVGFVTAFIANKPDPLCSFLAAVSAINADPQYYLGNDSFYIEPYFMAPLLLGDVSWLGGMRSVMRMGAIGYTSFNETDGPTRILPLPDDAPDPDVDVIIVGGVTAGAVAMAPIAEFLSKPTIGVLASGDDLSDKVGGARRTPSHTSMLGRTAMIIAFSPTIAQKALGTSRNVKPPVARVHAHMNARADTHTHTH